MKTIQFCITLLLLTACSNQTRSHDCKEYSQAVRIVGQQAALTLQVFQLRSKQDYIQFLNSMANGEKQSAKTFQSMKIKDMAAKKAQTEMVKAIEKISQNWQDQSAAVEALPEGYDKASIEKALKALKADQKALLRNLQKQTITMDNYCTR